MAETIEYKKISELPVAERFDGTEYVPLLKSGGNPRATLGDLKEYFRDSTLVLFDAIDPVSNPTISDAALSEESGAVFAIVYIPSKQVFAQRKILGGNNSYSSSFTRNTDYMVDGAVRADRVFFNIEDKELYVFNGSLHNIFDTVRINVMTEEEFENIENPIEGAFYATYEE